MPSGKGRTGSAFPAARRACPSRPSEHRHDKEDVMNAIWLVAIGSCLQGQGDVRYFPLDPGNTWSYTQPEKPAGGTMEISVATREGDLAHVFVRLLPGDTDPFLVGEKNLFERAPDRIEIDLAEEGPQPHYLFAEESWTHRDNP